jgi:hypothetical protein
MHAMAAPNEITVPQLLRLIGTPDAPVIVDISIDSDFSDGPFLTPGAFRRPHRDLHGVIPHLARPPAVVVCQKGIKLSQGSAPRLRAAGLLALSVRLSRQYRDDLAQLDAGIRVHDPRGGADEGHSWPGGRP